MDGLIRSTPGLCEECRHAKRLRTKIGATIYLCDLAKTDPRFPKYPRTPVQACEGFERGSVEDAP